ncbi:MAG: uncharacterized protein QOG94_2345 [Solirubrobacteraceae bacterium]|nr:uncharacterized protein [Solirubrobacteraceae bacterium]
MLISSHPRAYDRPLSPEQAWRQVEDWLAAPAIEHGLTLCSADTDFARFSELRWVDPVTS